LKVSPDDLKTLAMCWLRFTKQFDLVCTEDPRRSADVIGTDSSIQCRKMIEIETKVSISDLRADIKKGGGRFLSKHDKLAKATTFVPGNPHFSAVHGIQTENNDHSMLPTQFYFMVPEDLVDQARDVITTLYPHAGLMTGRPFSDGRFSDDVWVVRKAPVLHRLLIAKEIKGGISARMSSEICNLRIDKMREKWSNIVTGGKDASDANSNNRPETLPLETSDGTSRSEHTGEDGAG
jgi:hypothetical protein